jgi:hypothetical protein
MDVVLRFIERKSWGRGLRGASTAWFVVGAAAWMVGRARRRNDVVYRTVLKPGEQLTVVSRPPKKKR